MLHFNTVRVLTRMWLTVAGALTACSAFGAEPAAPAPPVDPLVRSRDAVVLPGSGHSWGFGALSPNAQTVFVARRENGLTVFDVVHQRAQPPIAGTEGANAVAFVPDADRAYLPATDGSVIILRLSDMTVIRRLPVTSANLNSAVYEPRSRRVILTSGRRAGRSHLFDLDPSCDCIVGTTAIDAAKIDPPIALGDGRLALPLRDEGVVAIWDAVHRETVAQWRYPVCARPSALAVDGERHRLFIACRGDAPVLLTVDADTGAWRATVPVGRDVNALAFDAERRWVLVPSGADARLTVIGQQDGDVYVPLGDIGTRPWGHNMVYSPSRGEAYVFSMDFTLPAKSAAEPKPETRFTANTFTVSTLRLREVRP